MAKNVSTPLAKLLKKITLHIQSFCNITTSINAGLATISKTPAIKRAATNAASGAKAPQSALKAKAAAHKATPKSATTIKRAA